MKPVDGGVCAPRGFRAGTAAAGVKTPGSSRLDCALVFSDTPARIAGVFTTNQVKAAPVQWSEGVCIRGAARAVFINSGNANACTGAQGIEDAQAAAEQIALALDVPVTEVAVLSTGVIGVPLPMDRISEGIAHCAASLTAGPEPGDAAARAIMTTDTVPKSVAREVELSSGTVRIGGMAKGAGMIAPNMATMLGVLTTDAALEEEDLRALLRGCVEKSFNCICVDNDQSTNDAVLLMANGAAGHPPLRKGARDHELFAAALEETCIALAQELVRDGEGATKFVTIAVEGAPCAASARRVARSIAQSMLCKTAFHGEDPNWGRIACAAGYSGVDFEPRNLGIWLDAVQVLHEGLPAHYEEAEAAAVLRLPAFTVRVSLGTGPGTCTFWTSDLSYEYIRINADYRT